MIRRDLAEILMREMRDPRLAMVTITSVDVARDFTIAKVYVSTIGTDAEKAAALKALQGASGFLRGMLGRMLELRAVPELVFRYDAGIDRGIRMFELLKDEERNFPVETPPGSDQTPEPAEAPEADTASEPNAAPEAADTPEPDA